MKCCKFCSGDPHILGATTQNLVSLVTCAQDLYAPVADYVLFNGRVTSDLGGKHSFIPLTCAECDDTLPFSGASSFPLCYIPFHPFPSTSLPSSLTLSCHLFLGVPLSLVASKFIYNTFLGILFTSILCTCQNQWRAASFI